MARHTVQRLHLDRAERAEIGRPLPEGQMRALRFELQRIGGDAHVAGVDDELAVRSRHDAVAGGQGLGAQGNGGDAALAARQSGDPQNVTGFEVDVSDPGVDIRSIGNRDVVRGFERDLACAGGPIGRAGDRLVHVNVMRTDIKVAAHRRFTTKPDLRGRPVDDHRAGAAGQLGDPQFDAAERRDPGLALNIQRQGRGIAAKGHSGAAKTNRAHVQRDLARDDLTDDVAGVARCHVDMRRLHICEKDTAVHGVDVQEALVLDGEQTHVVDRSDPDGIAAPFDHARHRPGDGTGTAKPSTQFGRAEEPERGGPEVDVAGSRGREHLRGPRREVPQEHDVGHRARFTKRAQDEFAEGTAIQIVQKVARGPDDHFAAACIDLGQCEVAQGVEVGVQLARARHQVELELSGHDGQRASIVTRLTVTGQVDGALGLEGVPQPGGFGDVAVDPRGDPGLAEEPDHAVLRSGGGRVHHRRSAVPVVERQAAIGRRHTFQRDLSADDFEGHVATGFSEHRRARLREFDFEIHRPERLEPDAARQDVDDARRVGVENPAGFRFEEDTLGRVDFLDRNIGRWREQVDLACRTGREGAAGTLRIKQRAFKRPDPAARRFEHDRRADDAAAAQDRGNGAGCAKPRILIGLERVQGNVDLGTDIGVASSLNGDFAGRLDVEIFVAMDAHPIGQNLHIGPRSREQPQALLFRDLLARVDENLVLALADIQTRDQRHVATDHIRLLDGQLRVEHRQDQVLTESGLKLGRREECALDKVADLVLGHFVDVVLVEVLPGKTLGGFVEPVVLRCLERVDLDLGQTARDHLGAALGVVGIGLEPVVVVFVP